MPVPAYINPAQQSPQIMQRRAFELSSVNAPWPYPWEYVPEDGQEFEVFNSVAAPAYGTANRTTVCTYQVPIGFAGVLKAFMCTASVTGFIQGSGSVVWNIDVNVDSSTLVAGYSAAGYETIKTDRGSFERLWPVYPGQSLRYRGGETLRLKVRTVDTVGTGAPNYMHGCLKGWIWPEQ